MRLSVLTDNRVQKRRGLLAEHGLSIFIEEGRVARYCFDTGQTNVLPTQCKTRCVLTVASANGIVLSHGHYDHCGGLVDFPGMTGRCRPSILVQRRA